MRITHIFFVGFLFAALQMPISSLDFLNDPFFKQLSSELDAMFSQTDEQQPLKPMTPPAHKPTSKPGAPATFEATPVKSASNPAEEKPAIHDSAKDLKNLFIESIVASSQENKQAGFKRVGFKQATPKQKIVISSYKIKAFNHYMDEFIKKIRLIEHIVASNPNRIFSTSFQINFNGIIYFIDKIEASKHLVDSKKMYLRTFFRPQLQKTREQIVQLLPKLDKTLKQLHPLLLKEESIADDDILRLQQEAQKPLVKTRAVKTKKKNSKKAVIKTKKLQPSYTFESTPTSQVPQSSSPLPSLKSVIQQGR